MFVLPAKRKGFCMPLLRYLIVSGSAAAMAGAVTLSGVTATTAAAPARASHAPSARFLFEARAALARYLRHHHPQALLAHPGRAHAIGGVTAGASFNWTGYADTATTAQTFTMVSGKWTAPSVSCTPEDQVTSDWVGLDGFNNKSVEQLGTLAQCFQGKPVYVTWFEMFPAGLSVVSTTLQAGDKIAASVTRSGTSYTLKLTDSTHTANSFTKTATCALTKCTDTSAEWISERPAFGIGIVPQVHYKAFKITNGSETANGKAGTIGTGPGVNSITMVDATDTYDLNTVSALTGGNSFSTTWKNSY